VETAPNPAIGELASVMGHDATREIVRLFLEDFPLSLGRLSRGSREEQHRIAHGLKSSALHMGARALSERMARIEALLATEGEGVGKAEIASAAVDFEAVAPALRAYAKVQGPRGPA